MYVNYDDITMVTLIPGLVEGRRTMGWSHIHQTTPTKGRFYRAVSAILVKMYCTMDNVCLRRTAS